MPCRENNRLKPHTQLRRYLPRGHPNRQAKYRGSAHSYRGGMIDRDCLISHFLRLSKNTQENDGFPQKKRCGLDEVRAFFKDNPSWEALQ
jgi:hypothetical protein